MTKCFSCGAEQPEVGRFCSSCGRVRPDDPLATTDGNAAITTPIPTDRSSLASHPSLIRPTSEGRFAPGTLLAGRYRIVALLGRGGMGEVYRADDLILGQSVALKFLPDGSARDAATQERFRGEVRIARQVSHPNVCRVYDVGEAAGQTFLSMEYIDGEDLASLLRRIGRLPGDKAVEIARQLCAGLAAAHREGVLHRDLKPANVMIDGRGRAVITDFGLAGLADRIEGAEIRSGTPAYMAPEQLEGKEVTVRSDLYSLGLVLYELFVGKPAFAPGPMADVLQSRRENAPSSPTSLVRDLDAAVEQVILRCLERDPARRPASAMAMAAALPGGDPLAAALAAGETPSPQMVAAAGETEGLSPRVALIALLAVVLGLGSFYFLSVRQNGLERMPLEMPPAALAQKAREIIADLGYSPQAADRGDGLAYDTGYLRHIQESDSLRRRWDELLTGRPSVLHYWYRQSPRPMIPGRLGANGNAITPGLLTRDDPPPTFSGMISLELDPQGRLRSWLAIPPQRETSTPAVAAHADSSRGSSLASPPASPPASPDWGSLFAAAGLDSACFRPTEPEWLSLADSDTRAAWIGAWPGGRQGGLIPLRVEAAAWQGKPVYFALISPWTRPDRMVLGPTDAGQRVQTFVMLAVSLLVWLLAAVLAYRHHVMRKSDLRGALRLVSAVLVIDLLVWICTAHVPLAATAMDEMIVGLGAALFLAGTVGLLYLALEPYVRRHWPQTIISWSRLMAGRVRDPLVGRDVLTGVALGTFWALLFDAGYLLKMRAGSTPQFATTGSMEGIRSAIGLVFGNVVGCILGTLVFFFVLFLLRVLLRKRILAAIGFVAIFTAANGLGNDQPLISIPVWIAVYTIAAIAVVRFGLIALAAGVFTANTLLNLPLTLEFTRWYAGNTFMVLLGLAALAGWGCRVSLGGRNLWRDGITD